MTLGGSLGLDVLEQHYPTKDQSQLIRSTRQKNPIVFTIGFFVL